MTYYAQRTTLYSIILSLAVCETAFGFFTGYMWGFSRLNDVVGKVSGSVSIVTWVWMIVLLSYNNRPTSTHYLTKAVVHVWSFFILVPVHLALGIIIISQLPKECDFKSPSDGLAALWCTMSALAGAFALMVAILSVITTFIIRCGSPDLQDNVCMGDLKAKTQR